MNLKDIYQSIQSYTARDSLGDTNALIELAGSYHWTALKGSVIEPMIVDLLSQADDMTKVMEGTMTLKQFGERAFIARATANKLQQIIDLVEQTHESVTGKT
jgi:hypothetical protein